MASTPYGVTDWIVDYALSDHVNIYKDTKLRSIELKTTGYDVASKSERILDFL